MEFAINLSFYSKLNTMIISLKNLPWSFQIFVPLIEYTILFIPIIEIIITHKVLHYTNEKYQNGFSMHI